MKRYIRYLAVFGALALVLAACSPSDADTTTTEATGGTQATEPTTDATEAPDATTTTAEPGPEAIKTCLVTDLAGVDERARERR